MITPKNTRFWTDDAQCHAEWGDRALDDDERYAPDSLIFTASVPRAEEAEAIVRARLIDQLNDWIARTRDGGSELR